MLKQVYSDFSVIMPGFLASVLEDAGIKSVLKNYYLNSATGECPFTEAWPSLWVDEADETAALKLIDAFFNAQKSAQAWQCPTCHERLEAQFPSCWQCGEPAPQPD